MLAIVTAFGYTAFLAGPGIIGFLSNHFGIQRAMILPFVAGLLSATLAHMAAAKDERISSATFFAAQQAEKVYCVEFNPDLVREARRFLAQNPDLKVLIQGNADERGSREYNQALGMRRAKAVS